MIARRLDVRESWSVEFDGTRLVFGSDAVERTGELVAEPREGRWLLVFDRGLRETDHPQRVRNALERAGATVDVFDDFAESPTTDDVDRGLRQAAGFRPDGFVALGGGSAMDCAKAINLLLANGGEVEDYRGGGKAARASLPSIGIPTTVGSGSDAQSFALITRPSDGARIACGDRKAKFRTVILDPSLLSTLPRHAVATSGIDAVSHVVESYVSRRANPISRILAEEAWQLIDPNFESAFEGPGAADARAAMLWAAHLAGASIEHSMLGAAHACANPLSARYGLVHGVAVALMLPAVMEFNSSVVGERYRDLSRAGGRSGEASLLDRVVRMRRAAGLPSRLSEAGVDREALPDLADAAIGQWTATFNPRPVTRDDLVRIYDASF